MTYRGNPLLEKLDRIAEYTGVPKLARRTAQDAAIPLRVMPLLPLTLAIVGLFVQAHAPAGGWIVVMGAWISAMPLGLTGPMRPPPGGVRDERERALVRTGHLAGLGAVALLAIGGCFLMGILGALAMVGYARVWLPQGPQDWIAIGFFLLVVQTTVAVLVASWMIPRGLADADEDDQPARLTRRADRRFRGGREG
ncbi:MAG TPA: hypothetical protein VNS79_13850 [Sphingobium sp.]|nr:hypothetical protein [Sphingobium sp.]